MRARQLEVFTAVMRAGTVTGAARLLHISQPALSQILRHTEDDLGFALFEREKGRLHPTPEAIELYPEAERLFASLEGLRRKSMDLRHGRAGLLRIAASTPPGMSLVPQALLRFRTKFPDILQRAHIAPIAGIIAMLRAGDAGLGMALDDRLPQDIDVEKLGETRFCCLLPQAHALVAKSQIAFADLQDDTVISYRGATRPHDELKQAAAQQRTEFVPQLEIDASISAVGFVQAGLGIAVVDALLPWSQFAGIVQRPLEASPNLPVSLLTVKDKALSLAEIAMQEQIRAICQETL